MKRLMKAYLLLVRKLSARFNSMKLYYWSEQELYALRRVNIMPDFYYRNLYQASMWSLRFRNCRRAANWVIHTIPFHIRFIAA